MDKIHYKKCIIKYFSCHVFPSVYSVFTKMWKFVKIFNHTCDMYLRTMYHTSSAIWFITKTPNYWKSMVTLLWISSQISCVPSPTTPFLLSLIGLQKWHLLFQPSKLWQTKVILLFFNKINMYHRLSISILFQTMDFDSYPRFGGIIQAFAGPNQIFFS